MEFAPPEQCILRGGDYGHPAVWEQVKKTPMVDKFVDKRIDKYFSKRKSVMKKILYNSQRPAKRDISDKPVVEYK